MTASNDIEDTILSGLQLRFQVSSNLTLNAVEIFARQKLICILQSSKLSKTLIAQQRLHRTQINHVYSSYFDQLLNQGKKRCS